MFIVLNYALRNLPTLIEDRMLPSCNSSVCPVSKSLSVTLLSPFLLIGSSSSTAWVSMPSASHCPLLSLFLAMTKPMWQKAFLAGGVTLITRGLWQPMRHSHVIGCVQGLCSYPSSSGSKQLRIPPNHFAFFPLAFSAAQLQLRTGIQMVPKLSQLRLSSVVCLLSKQPDKWRLSECYRNGSPGHKPEETVFLFHISQMQEAWQATPE